MIAPIGPYLVLLLAIFMVVASDDLETKTFTNAGNTKLLFVNEPKSFDQAVQWCKQMDSQLVELWYEREWDEVIH